MKPLKHLCRQRHLWAVLGAAILGISVFWGYPRWKLSHSYHCFLHMGKPAKAFFYDGPLLYNNRDTVREWLREDYLGATDILMALQRTDYRITLLLMNFGSKEDFELLLQKAAIGYPFPKGREPGQLSEHLISLRRQYCDMLVVALVSVASKLKEGKQKAEEYVSSELRRVGAADEVVEVFEARYPGLPDLQTKTTQQQSGSAGGDFENETSPDTEVAPKEGADEDQR